jgi:ubiquinone/menaquinone biosynthesis C-methylase UbiE
MPPTVDPAFMKQQIAAHWGVRAETLDVSDWHVAKTVREDRAWQRLFKRHLPLGKRLRVLDLGTGLGYLAGVAATLGHEAYGVDIAPRMIERAGERAARLGLGIDLRVADCDALPFPGGFFDAVTERNVIWTMPEPARTMTEIRRVLKPYGYVISIESRWLARPTDRPESPAGGGPNMVEHYRDFLDSLPLMGGPTARQLTDLVTAHGFGNVEVSRMRGVYEARVAFNPGMARPRGQRPYLLRATRLPEPDPSTQPLAPAKHGNSDER